MCLLGNAIAAETSNANEPALIETVDSGSDNSNRSNSVALGLTNETDRFGDYELVDEIARGGMGVVYKARHKKLGREVALKVILSGQFATSNDVRRFQLEAESAANLDHPGIVPIYEIGEHGGHHYFTMKLIEGGSLSQKMPELREDIRAFVDVLANVADAIAYAHRRGILHRDIKPANILLDGDGKPLVTDLGLAKHTDADSDLTGTGAIVGTPAYMPPEQATASKEITTEADVFAIGAILYEGLTGRPPFQGESAVATLMQAAKGEIAAPSQVRRGVDRTLELICLKCLCKEPSERYASAGLLAKDLRNWLDGEPVSVRPKSFAATFSDLMANQFRSAVGAMIIGAMGGFFSAFPVYSGIARAWFAAGSRFSIVSLQESLPNFAFDDSWWLHPPEWMSNSGVFTLGVMLSVFLGMLIHWIVRPNDTRQAIAIGLVAGLLMTLVQFAMYGNAAIWQGFGLQNAEEVQLLAQASLAPEEHRQEAVDKIMAAYPDLANVDPISRGELLGKAVAVRIMLSTPAIFGACLLVCLTFSTVYCVGGTVHANRIAAHGSWWLPSLIVYLEVMLIMTMAVLFTTLTIFFLFGMVTNSSGMMPLPLSMLFLLATLLVVSIPGWRLSRWYVRWAAYVASMILWILASQLGWL